MIQVYEIKGIHCHSCIAKIKPALAPITDTIEITLNPPRAQLTSAKIIPVAELNDLLATVGDYQFIPISGDKNTDKTGSTSWLRRYYPLILIFLYILSVSLFSQHKMHAFMAGFFLVFSGFKLLDLPGFAKAYATYDLLAKRWPAYGLIYPFLELILGFAYLTLWQSALIYVFTILLMGFSSLGVIQALAKKQKIQCACLGTVLNLPMTVITLAEDLAMVLMAVVMLCTQLI